VKPAARLSCPLCRVAKAEAAEETWLAEIQRRLTAGQEEGGVSHRTAPLRKSSNPPVEQFVTITFFFGIFTQTVHVGYIYMWKSHFNILI
jgi:hypothetical protein